MKFNSDVRSAPVAARLSPSERAGIVRLAKAHDRTVSREVSRAIRFYVANQDDAEQYLCSLPVEEGAVEG